MEEQFNAINTAEDVRSLLAFAELNSADPEPLRKRILAGFEVEQIKQNPKRKVYRLSCPDGSVLYLKLFARQGFLSREFRFYAQREYQAARDLENLGLPVIHYLAWGRLRRGGFCLSEGIPAAVPARRYFFETLIHQPELRMVFLDRLSKTVLQMVRKRICHPDFHLGNILYSTEERKLYLADPWGVRGIRWFWRNSHLELLCLPWVEMSGNLTEEELLTGVQGSGLASGPESARMLLSRTQAAWSRRLRKHWNKLSARILSGHSKFATEVNLPCGRCSFRHTEWFEAPEKLELDAAWREEKFNSEAGSRKAWLDSFLRIPPAENPPLARLVRPDGSSSLFYQDPSEK